MSRMCLNQHGYSPDLHHEQMCPRRRRGHRRAIAESTFGRSRDASRLLEALLLELSVDLCRESIAGPKRRDELVSPR